MESGPTVPVRAAAVMRQDARALMSEQVAGERRAVTGYQPRTSQSKKPRDLRAPRKKYKPGT